MRFLRIGLCSLVLACLMSLSGSAQTDSEGRALAWKLYEAYEAGSRGGNYNQFQQLFMQNPQMTRRAFVSTMEYATEIYQQDMNSASQVVAFANQLAQMIAQQFQDNVPSSLMQRLMRQDASAMAEFVNYAASLYPGYAQGQGAYGPGAQPGGYPGNYGPGAQPGYGPGGAAPGGYPGAYGPGAQPGYGPGGAAPGGYPGSYGPGQAAPGSYGPGNQPGYGPGGAAPGGYPGSYGPGAQPGYGPGGGQPGYGPGQAAPGSYPGAYGPNNQPGYGPGGNAPGGYPNTYRPNTTGGPGN